MAAASLFVRFIGFLYRLPLTTLIGDEGNAYYAAGYNIYTFALILSSMGLPAAISKLVSERIALKQFKNAHEVFRVAMKIAMIGGAACSIFLALGAGWLARVTGYPEAVYAIRTLSPTIFIVAVMAVYRGYFQGMNTTVPTAVSQAVEQVFNAVFSIWLAYLFFDAAKIEFSAAGGTAGTGVGAVAGLLVIVGIYALLSKDIKARIDGEQRRMFHSRSFSSYDVKRPNERNRFDENQRVLAKEIIKIAFPIIIGTAIFSIANFIDMTMAQSRLEASGAFDYGEIKVLYGQFTGKYVLLTTLPVSLSTALAVAAVPSIAGSKMVSDHAAVKGKINMALRLSMIVSIPAAVGLGVLSDPILKLLIPRHPEGGILLRYGVAAIIMLALVQTVTGILQGIGKVNVPVVGALLGTLLKVPLNYFLIANPKINIIGAVLSSCAMYLVAALVGIYFLNKYTGITPDIKG
ncbi:MAG: polysaccharide biosynthesis protein, partial [Defluviitaleaceae bacterium]|nr:polysaccharide biosynthesis protein [Defluviitaleaceae bacterium]